MAIAQGVDVEAADDFVRALAAVRPDAETAVDPPQVANGERVMAVPTGHAVARLGARGDVETRNDRREFGVELDEPAEVSVDKVQPVPGVHVPLKGTVDSNGEVHLPDHVVAVSTVDHRDHSTIDRAALEVGDRVIAVPAVD